jgi:mRNA interferase RelE/StbE
VGSFSPSRNGSATVTTVPAGGGTQLRKLPEDTQRRLRAATEALCRQPRPPGAVKLAGTDDLWRIRVGDRVIYTIVDEVLVVTVVRVANRRQVYRGI